MRRSTIKYYQQQYGSRCKPNNAEPLASAGAKSPAVDPSSKLWPPTCRTSQELMQQRNPAQDVRHGPGVGCSGSGRDVRAKQASALRSACVADETGSLRHVRPLTVACASAFNVAESVRREGRWEASRLLAAEAEACRPGFVGLAAPLAPSSVV